VDALDRIAHNNGRTQANRTLSTIRCVLDFYGNRDDDYRPPQLSKLNRKLAARDRVLKDDEIKRIWDAGDRFANFLLLTAARRSEVAGMQWKEIVGSDWILPAARNQKTGLDLVRPLSKRAMALLPKRGDDDAFVFGHVPDKPLRGYGSLKRRLDAASGVTGWRLHDLRRTARTLLSRVRVSVDHAERCLGHIVGGVRGIYDRHEFHAEKADAFEALSRQIGLDRQSARQGQQCPAAPAGVVMANRKKRSRIAPPDEAMAAELRAQAKYQERVLRDREKLYRETRDWGIAKYVELRLPIDRKLKEIIVPDTAKFFRVSQKHIWNVLGATKRQSLQPKDE
jgi:hypothetical protein